MQVTNGNNIGKSWADTAGWSRLVGSTLLHEEATRVAQQFTRSLRHEIPPNYDVAKGSGRRP